MWGARVERRFVEKTLQRRPGAKPWEGVGDEIPGS